jgi:hypothetical protein
MNRFRVDEGRASKMGIRWQKRRRLLEIVDFINFTVAAAARIAVRAPAPDSAMMTAFQGSIAARPCRAC